MSSIAVTQAPGLAQVLVSGVPEVPADFAAWLEPYGNERSAQLADPGDDGKAVLILTRFANARSCTGSPRRWGCVSS